MLHLRLLRGALWALSAAFGSLGVFLLYFGVLLALKEATVEAVILIGAAATTVWFLPD